MPVQMYLNGSELEALAFTREKSYLKAKFDKEYEACDFLEEARESAAEYIKSQINREDIVFFYPRGKHLKIVFGFTLFKFKPSKEDEKEDSQKAD